LNVPCWDGVGAVEFGDGWEGLVVVMIIIIITGNIPVGHICGQALSLPVGSVQPACHMVPM
jgi:hypothetical protein